MSLRRDDLPDGSRRRRAVDDVLDRLRPHGAELVGEVAQYGDIYRYCYVRGPAGVIIGLVEELR